MTPLLLICYIRGFPVHTQSNASKRLCNDSKRCRFRKPTTRNSTLFPQNSNPIRKIQSKMPSVVSQALIARSVQSSRLIKRTLISLKQRHTFAEGTLIEIDLETSTESGDSNAVRIVRLEDLMHTIIVRRSAPSWLPFIPGSSYWVPPKLNSKKVANLLSKCSLGSALSAEEALSLTSVRGWPSSDHLLRGKEPGEVKPKDSKAADSEVQVNSVYIKTKCPNDEEESD